MQSALGLTVVIVEDEPLLTMLLEELLDELGCTLVCSATTVADGLAKVDSRDFDIAILDVHLRGEPVWPLADRLREASRPFIIASGDSREALLARYPLATILSKPYELESLSHALRSEMARHTDGQKPLTSDDADG